MFGFWYLFEELNVQFVIIFLDFGVVFVDFVFSIGVGS